MHFGLMETIIKSVLAAPTLTDKIKLATITKLLTNAGTLSTSDADILLDLGIELGSNPTVSIHALTGSCILQALSIRQRGLFWDRFTSDWFQEKVSEPTPPVDYLHLVPLLVVVFRTKKVSATTEAEKQEVEENLALIQKFADKQCVSASTKLDFHTQGIFVMMFHRIPESKPLSTSKYIEFLVDHLAMTPLQDQPLNKVRSSNIALSLLQQTWADGPDNIYLTIPQVFINLSNNEQDCSIGAGFVLQILPESYTSVVDPFIQDLDSFVLWKIRFTVQRLIDWLVQHDMPGIGVWIVSIMESLASRGEVMMLRELATQNAYKVARQLAFKERRDDAFLVLKFMLLGYHHSPILFNNIVQGLIPLLASCRKSTESLAFATEVCTLAQTLLIHFGDSDNISDKVHKARILLSLPVVTRPDALRTIQEYSWKNSLQLQKTSAGFRSQPKLAQPLGKVGLVNLGNSCFMNSALRALYCTPEFKQVILSETPKVESSKVTTTRMRETFVGLSSPRLSIFNPNILYRALPEWLNDGHQQDAAEFTKVLFSLLEEESPISKKALSSFHGTVINQVKCGTCLSVSTTKEDFYDLAIPLPRSDGEELQALLDIFPSVEELNAEHHNQYYCDKCQTLRDAKRYTMLGSLPTNLIVSLNRFEYEVQRARRIKINTPIRLKETIQVRLQDGNHGFAMYDLYAVVIHTGDSANHGHYYTYAKELPQTAEEQEKNKAPETGKLPWLLYNDTRISLSSFDSIQQTVSKSKTDTPYMLFFRKTGMAGEGRIVHPNL